VILLHAPTDPTLAARLRFAGFALLEGQRAWGRLARGTTLAALVVVPPLDADAWFLLRWARAADLPTLVVFHPTLVPAQLPRGVAVVLSRAALPAALRRLVGSPTTSGAPSIHSDGGPTGAASPAASVSLLSTLRPPVLER